MSQKIIYLKGYPNFGEVTVDSGKKRAKKMAQLLSRALIIGGLSAVILLTSPFLFTEVNYRLYQLKNKNNSAQAGKSFTKFGLMAQISDLNILNPVDINFSLVIPKINLNVPVIGNVAVSDKQTYDEALEKGVAHADGSYLPGQSGTIYLFGHSSNYLWNWLTKQPTFYNLNKLAIGDQINVFYQSQRYVYQVNDKKVVAAADLSLLQPRSGEEKLVLQTCWPLGTNWQRLLVTAERV